MAYQERLLTLLQIIETGIIDVYSSHPEMYDHHALSAVECALDFFIAVQRIRNPRKFNLDELSREASDTIIRNIQTLFKVMEDEKSKHPDREPLYNLNDVVDALKTIKASIGKWTKMNGRQGYLNFVAKYV